MNRQTRLKLIYNNRINDLIELWENDDENKYGTTFWRDIPSDERFDDMFEIFERYYDTSRAKFRDVCNDRTCSLQAYGVRRRKKWH